MLSVRLTAVVSDQANTLLGLAAHTGCLKCVDRRIHLGQMAAAARAQRPFLGPTRQRPLLTVVPASDGKPHPDRLRRSFT